MEEEAQPPTELPDDIEATPLKPKRTRRITQEQRERQAEIMRKVNADRIEKARLKNEESLKIQEQKVKERLEKVKAKQEKVTKIKEEKKIPVEKAEKKSVSKPKIKPVRKLIIESSEDETDSEDYGDETETEVVYLTKKKSVSKPKAKPEKKPQESVKKQTQPIEQKMVFKFI